MLATEATLPTEGQVHGSAPGTAGMGGQASHLTWLYADAGTPVQERLCSTQQYTKYKSTSVMSASTAR